MPPRAVPTTLRSAAAQTRSTHEAAQSAKLSSSSTQPSAHFTTAQNCHSPTHPLLRFDTPHSPIAPIDRSQINPRFRYLSTMANNTNEACCSIPPVQSDYSPKGTTEKLGGLDVYAIGPKDSKKAIVVVYDIFGYWPTTKQGADILAEATKARVVMPDFFRGKPFPQEYYPPNTKDKQEALQSFFGAAGDFSKRKPELEAVAAELKSNGAAKVGLVGFCWGGKLSVLAGAEGTPFTSVSQVHPAMVDPKDAAGLTVPIANFPSKDEPKDAVEAFEKEIQNKPFAKDSVYKNYSESHHGWAAARADLNDKHNFENFQDVYQRLANFFNKTLA
ncbi:alpha/beta-hydrolase [Testicularia cyperi]|uniref:Alpha/beta-hydrolase n=1 Tax=Testicularia cyperi TaxID=1882483 RepID=A0A317XT66_9BASI|nr:alpha/beta-hydrolase [Testicularia cyperi]